MKFLHGDAARALLSDKYKRLSDNVRGLDIGYFNMGYLDMGYLHLRYLSIGYLNAENIILCIGILKLLLF